MQKNLWKFTLSSFLSFLLDYLLFFIFTKIFPETASGVLAANILARILSASCNYLINSRIVFGKDGSRKTALQYALLACFILGMNNVVLLFYINVLGIARYPSKIATELTLFIVSYVVQKKMIFHHKI